MVFILDYKPPTGTTAEEQSSAESSTSKEPTTSQQPVPSPAISKAAASRSKKESQAVHDGDDSGSQIGDGKRGDEAKGGTKAPATAAPKAIPLPPPEKKAIPLPALTPTNQAIPLSAPNEKAATPAETVKQAICLPPPEPKTTTASTTKVDANAPAAKKPDLGPAVPVSLKPATTEDKDKASKGDAAPDAATQPKSNNTKGEKERPKAQAEKPASGTIGVYSIDAGTLKKERIAVPQDNEILRNLRRPGESKAETNIESASAKESTPPKQTVHAEKEKSTKVAEEAGRPSQTPQQSRPSPSYNGERQPQHHRPADQGAPLRSDPSFNNPAVFSHGGIDSTLPQRRQRESGHDGRIYETHRRPYAPGSHHVRPDGHRREHAEEGPSRREQYYRRTGETEVERERWRGGDSTSRQRRPDRERLADERAYRDRPGDRPSRGKRPSGDEGFTSATAMEDHPDKGNQRRDGTLSDGLDCPRKITKNPGPETAEERVARKTEENYKKELREKGLFHAEVYELLMKLNYDSFAARGIANNLPKGKEADVKTIKKENKAIATTLPVYYAKFRKLGLSQNYAKSLVEGASVTQDAEPEHENESTETDTEPESETADTPVYNPLSTAGAFGTAGSEDLNASSAFTTNGPSLEDHFGGDAGWPGPSSSSERDDYLHDASPSGNFLRQSDSWEEQQQYNAPPLDFQSVDPTRFYTDATRPSSGYADSNPTYSHPSSGKRTIPEVSEREGKVHGSFDRFGKPVEQTTIRPVDSEELNALLGAPGHSQVPVHLGNNFPTVLAPSVNSQQGEQVQRTDAQTYSESRPADASHGHGDSPYGPSAYYGQRVRVEPVNYPPPPPVTGRQTGVRSQPLPRYQNHSTSHYNAQRPHGSNRY
ncbi:hypothetical protein BJ508DRAFT_330994 [Ascobolus immersus RN42]|uniref:Uncharacterized protein n=1 Tax=Ascobolus immersus RN42 TaxID=1160509 RepID=A0A3N4HS67_ASCIM|nr:hypothetical protein BJ508DRAFT_330994 [Ascobolus immersus RN42]